MYTIRALLVYWNQDFSKIHELLSDQGFNVDTASWGGTVPERALDSSPDIIILDMRLPDIDGPTVCRLLRAEGWNGPVMLVGHSYEVADCVRGLKSGADDYIHGSCNDEEIIARIHALVRRVTEFDETRLAFADLVVDLNSHEVQRGERYITLTAREFELLTVFLRHPRQVLSRNQLLQKVWNFDTAVDPHVVDVYVGYLRKRLEASGETRLIHTKRGVGFVLTLPSKSHTNTQKN